jgi:hypothetical protein
LAFASFKSLSAFKSLVTSFKFTICQRAMETSPITTEFCGCATGITGKIVAASATVTPNDIYLAFQIFQSYICNVISLFIQKENG